MIRRLLPWLAAVMAAASAAIFFLWLIFASRVEEEAGLWAEARRAEGFIVSWQRLDIGGFPFYFDLGFVEPRLAKDGWSLEAPVVSATLLPWRLHKVDLAAPRLAVTGPGGAAGIEALKAQLLLEGGRAKNLTAEGVAATARQRDGDLGRADRATIGGRPLAGAKGSILDGGGRVPMIVSWPGVTPAGRVSADLVDSSDFLPTFAALAGAKLPEKIVIDGRSFAAQLRGETSGPRSWVFHQLARNWYVREAGWKLNQAGELFDMSDAPFAEKLVAAGSETPSALAARQRLTAALAQLNPAGGIPDTGDESGRHAKNVEAKKKKERKK